MDGPLTLRGNSGDLLFPLPFVPYRRDSKMAKIPTVESQGRKWKVWIVDETDVTITVRVRPLRVKESVAFTFPFRDEFRVFARLAAEAVDRYDHAWHDLANCHPVRNGNEEASNPV